MLLVFYLIKNVKFIKLQKQLLIPFIWPLFDNKLINLIKKLKPLGFIKNVRQNCLLMLQYKIDLQTIIIIFISPKLWQKRAKVEPGFPLGGRHDVHEDNEVDVEESKTRRWGLLPPGSLAQWDPFKNRKLSSRSRSAELLPLKPEAGQPLCGRERAVEEKVRGV